MNKHITIAFDKPQELIVTLLKRFDLSCHNIQINQENYDFMVHIHQTHLSILDTQIRYPILFTDFVAELKDIYINQT